MLDEDAPASEDSPSSPSLSSSSWSCSSIVGVAFLVASSSRSSLPSSSSRADSSFTSFVRDTDGD